MAPPTPVAASRSRTRYRNAAVDDGGIRSIRPAGADADRRPEEGTAIVDANPAALSRVWRVAWIA